MLCNEFYTIHSEENIDAQQFICTIYLNADSTIYKGHFPERPITPGACLIQISKELIAKHLNKNIIISQINQIKFVELIIPTQHPDVTTKVKLTDLTDNQQKADIIFCHDETIYAKLSYIIQPAEE